MWLHLSNYMTENSLIEAHLLEFDFKFNRQSNHRLEHKEATKNR